MPFTLPYARAFSHPHAIGHRNGGGGLKFNPRERDFGREMVPVFQTKNN